MVHGDKIDRIWIVIYIIGCLGSSIIDINRDKVLTFLTPSLSNSIEKIHRRSLTPIWVLLRKTIVKEETKGTYMTRELTKMVSGIYKSILCDTDQ